MTYTWDMMIRDAGITGSTKMIRRDELKAGDRALSSHYGVRTVAAVAQYGDAGQTTHIKWEGGTDAYPLTERYDSESQIPLVFPFTYIVTTLHGKCRECNAELDAALAAGRLAKEPVSTYNNQGHGATVERETYAQRRAALGLPL